MSVNKLSSKHEFSSVMMYIDAIMKIEKTDKDRILMLDYLADLIKRDIKYDLLTRHIYDVKINRRAEILPRVYYDEKGVKRNLEPVDNREVSLGDDMVLTIPWCKTKRIETLTLINKKDFIFDKGNHWGYYYSYLDFCFVYNGIHSVSAGDYFQKGFIVVPEIDVSKIFPHIYTDGEFWFNTHTNEKLSLVWDFRIAILYEIAKLKENLVIVSESGI